MATLAPPFVLCPLSENKELIGFSKDREESNVVVTLGRNIAIRYLVAEQKQETSWTCSRHWFTSKVVYCFDVEKYAAVVDEYAVWMWDESDISLTNAKKYKFKQEIFEVVPTMTLGTLLVFKNGFVSPLSEAAKPENRKYVEGVGPINSAEFQLLTVSVHENKNLVFLTVGAKLSDKKLKSSVEKQSKLNVYVWKVSGIIESCECISQSRVAIKEGEIILGWTIMSNEDDSFLLYLGSNGDLMRMSILKPTIISEDSMTTEAVALTKKGALQKYVSLEKPVVITPYDETSIICYGPDSLEEGAVVLVYDVQFDLVLSRQSLKLYSCPPITERVNGNIFIPLGLNILVVGLRVGKSLLSAVAGRHKIQSVDFFESRDPWKTGWEQKASVPRKEKQVSVEDLNDTVYNGIDLMDLEAIVDTLEKNGYPESLICAQVIPQALEKSDDTAVKWILEYFDEIPEKLLVDLIVSLVIPVKSTNHTAMETESKKTQTPSDVQLEMIHNVVMRSCDLTELVKNLKSVSYADAKTLLEALIKFQQETSLIPANEVDSDSSTECLGKTIKWIGAILDAQYTNFVFNSEVDIIDKLLKILNEKIQFMREIEALGPLVEMVLSKTKYDARPNRNSLYRVESVVFT